MLSKKCIPCKVFWIIILLIMYFKLISMTWSNFSSSTIRTASFSLLNNCKMIIYFTLKTIISTGIELISKALVHYLVLLFIAKPKIKTLLNYFRYQMHVSLSLKARSTRRNGLYHLHLAHELNFNPFLGLLIVMCIEIFVFSWRCTTHKIIE